MGTALAVTQQQSSEATTRTRERTHGTDRCPRCSGLMVAEWCEDLSELHRSTLCSMWRDCRSSHCAQPRGPARTDDNSFCREDVVKQLCDEGSTEVCLTNQGGPVFTTHGDFTSRDRPMGPAFAVHGVSRDRPSRSTRSTW